MPHDKCILLAMSLSFLFATNAVCSDTTATAEADSMVLKGSEEGTIFKSLRIEGEDRVRIEFERPTLDLRLDALSAPGLEWEGFHSVLERRPVDLFDPLLAQTATDDKPIYARPWLDRIADNGVARFRPALEGVERWQLVVVDSRGGTVATFEGKGKPPKEIVWDGRAIDGRPILPGLTYSYVLEAYDRAGNKRNFVGDGFEIPAYQVATENGMAVLFDGGELAVGPTEAHNVPPVLLETASRINQGRDMSQPIRVEITARRYEDAMSMGENIVQFLAPLVLGVPTRIQVTTDVAPDAPERGAVQIAFSPAPAKR